jgi:hypothetical protein
LDTVFASLQPPRLIRSSCDVLYRQMEMLLIFSLGNFISIDYLTPFMQKSQVHLSALDESKDTIVDTIKRNQADGKHLKDVAEKSYFNFLMTEVFAEMITDSNIMADVLERVKTKMTANDNEAFNLRIVKLIKPEIIEMFKEDIAGIMGRKSVVLDNYFPSRKNDATVSGESTDEEETTNEES